MEGRVAGPWVAELARAWTEVTPRLGQKKLSIDVRSVTFADAEGTAELRAIVAQSNAEVIASSPWTQYLADEIRRSNSTDIHEETQVGFDNNNDNDDERVQERTDPEVG